MSVHEVDRAAVTGEVPWSVWRQRRLPWLAASFFCVLAAALVSLLLPPRPNPWRPEGGFASRDFWLAPIESNGFRRLPAVSISSLSGAFLSAALSADGKTALAVGEQGTILRSSDAGATWSPAATGTVEILLSVALSADGKTALAAGSGGTILRSSDGGTTWSAEASGTAEGLSSVALSADGKIALAAGGKGTILRSTDGGTMWSAAASDTTADLHSVALSADGKTALAVGE